MYIWIHFTYTVGKVLLEEAMYLYLGFGLLVAAAVFRSFSSLYDLRL